MDERIYQDIIGGLWILGVGVLVPACIYVAVALLDRYLPGRTSREG